MNQRRHQIGTAFVVLGGLTVIAAVVLAAVTLPQVAELSLDGARTALANSFQADAGTVEGSERQLQLSLLLLASGIGSVGLGFVLQGVEEWCRGG